MRVIIQHQINKEDLSNISQRKLKLSHELISHLSFSKYQDCLIKILIPKVSSEIYSIIHCNHLKISDIEGIFFQAFIENEILYTALEIDESLAESSYRLNFSKRRDFSDLIIENPPKVSKEVISYLKQSV